MADRIVKLSFQAPVHFGNRRLSDSEYTCDAATLFSALYIEALGAGCADDLLRAARAGELTLSDAFPYIDERLYIPKPMIAAPHAAVSHAEQSDSRERKANKNLKYIPLDQLSGYLAGSFDFIGELDKFNLGSSFLRTKVNLTRENSEDAEPYHVGGFAFNPGCGIYFIVRGSFDIASLVEQLGYSGLGGKRTSGYGRFTAEFVGAEPFEAALSAASTGRSMLLSSAAPCENELVDELLAGAKYHLERKGGFVQSSSHATTPRKKRDMWLFSPGSVFSRRFAGDVFDVNVTPGTHAVLRYARAMWMEV